MRPRALAALAGVAAVAGVVLPVVPASATPAADWHVFVYIVNDSESQLPYGQDIDEMLVASASTGIDFTVFLDSSELAGPAMSTTAVPNTGEAVVIEITDGVLAVTQRLGELDSGAPDTLAWFLASGLIAHPTARAALVLWDHGAGWNGIGFDEDVSADGSRRASSLDSADLTLAIQNGLAAGGRARLDLVVFDACLMASIDTLGSMQGLVDHIVASEEVIPGLGLDYGAWTVLTQPAVDATMIFDALANAYETEVADAQPSDAEGYTLSMFDVNQAPAINAALGQFAAAAAADVGVNPDPYLQATAGVHQYGVSGEFWFGFVDLGEYLNGLVGVSPAVTAARDQLLASVQAARIGQRNGSPNFDAATGLTVYFPTEPRDFDASFQELATSAPWMPFLEAFYNAQAGVVLQTDVGFAAETLSIAPLEPNIYEITVPVTANFTGSVELLAATSDAAGVRTYFESDSGEINAAGAASAVILPTLTTVSDGTREAVPFTRYVRQADGFHGYSAFTLQRANGSVAQLNWDRKVDEGPFTVVDNGVVVAYTPQAGDLAYPQNLVQQPGAAPELVAIGTGLDPNRLWTVTDALIAPGTDVYLELRLLDANGNVIDTVIGSLVAGQ